jgi:hypothetical protein
MAELVPLVPVHIGEGTAARAADHDIHKGKIPVSDDILSRGARISAGLEGRARKQERKMGGLVDDV